MGEMQLDFLRQPALGADAVAVADDEHPDHQLGIDRGPADVAVVRFELLVEAGAVATTTSMRRRRWFLGMRSSRRSSSRPFISPSSPASFSLRCFALAASASVGSASRIPQKK